MSNLDFPQLRQTLNRGFDFGMKEISKSGLELASNGDLALALLKLKEWHSKGWVTLLRNPLTAEADEICVVMLAPINGDFQDPLSGPLGGKM